MLTRLMALGFLLLAGKLGAQQFDWTADAKAVYQKALHLRLSEAEALYQKAQKRAPQNLLLDFAADYIDFFKVFIDEKEGDYEVVLNRQAQRLKDLSDTKTASPYRLYCMAEIHLHQAMLRAKFEDYLGAFTSMRKAYKLLEKNKESYPDFISNSKTLGLMHAIAGTIPEEFRWGARLLGFSGNIKEGLREMETVIAHIKKEPSFVFKEETQIMYAFLLLHVSNQPYRSWRVVQKMDLEPRESPVAAFVLATFALHTGQNDKAIAILETRAKGKAYHPFHYLDLLLGVAKLHRLDADAKQYLLRYVQQHPGRHYLKEAYQKLAWEALLNGSSSLYDYYMKQLQKKGASAMAVDQKALKQAERKEEPHPDLLRAQLLFDGGYYERALNVIEELDPYSFKRPDQSIEWVYRRGRILHRLGYYDKAVAAYKQTLLIGSDSPFYYACNAALQIGRIYEYQSKWTEAAVYFKRCLELKPDSYRASLHQKAQAGLQRVGGS